MNGDGAPFRAVLAALSAASKSVLGVLEQLFRVAGHGFLRLELPEPPLDAPFDGSC